MASCHLDCAGVEDRVICPLLQFSFLATLKDKPLKVHGTFNGIDFNQHCGLNGTRDHIDQPSLHLIDTYWGTKGFPMINNCFWTYHWSSGLGLQSLNLILTHPTMNPVSHSMPWHALGRLSKTLRVL